MSSPETTISLEIDGPTSVNLPKNSDLSWRVWVKNHRTSHLPVRDWDGRTVALIPPGSAEYEVIGYDG